MLEDAGVCAPACMFISVCLLACVCSDIYSCSSAEQLRTMGRCRSHKDTTFLLLLSHCSDRDSAVHWSFPPATHTHSPLGVFHIWPPTQDIILPLKLQLHLFTSSTVCPGWVTRIIQSVPFLDIHPSHCSPMNRLNFCLVCSTGNQTPNLSSISSTCRQRKSWGEKWKQIARQKTERLDEQGRTHLF